MLAIDYQCAGITRLQLHIASSQDSDRSSDSTADTDQHSGYHQLQPHHVTACVLRYVLAASCLRSAG